MKLANVIKSPIVTEKSVDLASKGKYVFKVGLTATKGFIKEEVKRLFGVDAVKVHTSIIPGKNRRVKNSRSTTRSPSWKKAIVELKEGQKIDLIPQEK